jgi:hypothetical protein
VANPRPVPRAVPVPDSAVARRAGATGRGSSFPGGVLMKRRNSLVAMSLLPVLAFVVADAAATQSLRREVVQAAGICVSGAPTDDVRHRVGGLRNAGTEALYVICSFGGEYDKDSTESKNMVAIQVLNTGPATVTGQCVLHPGYPTTSSTTSEGSYVQTKSLAPGEQHIFQFNASDYVDPEDGFGTPNIVCKLNQRVELQWIQANHYEEIGI